MGKALVDMGLLAEIDRAAFLSYCDYWGRWMYYRAQVGKYGDKGVTAGGHEHQSADVQMMNKAEEGMRKTLSLFGLSPSDRTRVSTMSTKKVQDNPFRAKSRASG